VRAGAASITPIGSGGSRPNRTRNGDIAVPRAGEMRNASRIWGRATSHSCPPACSKAALRPAFKSRCAPSPLGSTVGGRPASPSSFTPRSSPSWSISSPVNWLPLSLWISSGKPNLGKMSCSRCRATASAVARRSGKGLDPLGERVLDRQGHYVAAFRARQRPHEVDAEALERVTVRHRGVGVSLRLRRPCLHLARHARRQHMLRRRLPGQHVRVLGGHRGGRLQPSVAHQLVAVPEIGHLNVEGHHWPRLPSSGSA
jgi:hypothetical protein